MPLKTLFFLTAFFLGAGASLYTPIVGVIGYFAHYHLWPEAHWWGAPLHPYGLRYSATFFGVAFIGYLLGTRNRRTFLTVISSQEWLLIAIIVLLWTFLPTIQSGTLALRPGVLQENLMVKLSKIIIFVLLLSRIVVSIERFRAILWTLAIGSLYLGYMAFTAPQFQFSQGRLNGIGGPDFGESSYLGAHFIVMLPIIGVLFLRGHWKVKLLCLIIGGFTVNGFLLTRTRAAFVALAVGLVLVLILGVGGNRKKLLLYLIPASCVTIALMDQGFLKRMMNLYGPDGQLEPSAQNRLNIWTYSTNLILDHPLGVGPGNFPRYIADYGPSLKHRDAHNALVRCTAELGIQGLVLYLALYLNAFRLLWRSSRLARGTPYGLEIHAYASVLALSLAMFFTCGLFMTNLYIESVWWMLALPVCLFRSAESCLASKAQTVHKQRAAALALYRPPRPALQPAAAFATPRSQSRRWGGSAHVLMLRFRQLASKPASSP